MVRMSFGLSLIGLYLALGGVVLASLSRFMRQVPQTLMNSWKGLTQLDKFSNPVVQGILYDWLIVYYEAFCGSILTFLALLMQFLSIVIGEYDRLLMPWWIAHLAGIGVALGAAMVIRLSKKAARHGVKKITDEHYALN